MDVPYRPLSAAGFTGSEFAQDAKARGRALFVEVNEQVIRDERRGRFYVFFISRAATASRIFMRPLTHQHDASKQTAA